MRTQQGQLISFYQRVRYSVQFYLRHRGDSSVGSIVGSVTQGHQRIRFSLGYGRIPVFYWDSVRQRVLPDHPRHSEINGEIDRVIEQIHVFFSTTSNFTFSDTDGISPITRLQSHLFPHQRKTTESHQTNSVVRLFTRFIREHDNKGKSLSLGTLKQYKVVLSTWKMFEKEVGRTFVISDFSVRTQTDESRSKKVVEKFRRFLIEQGGNGVPLTDNTTRNYMKILNTFIRWSEREIGVPLVRNVRMTGGRSRSQHLRSDHVLASYVWSFNTRNDGQYHS